ncbi:acyl-CoA dehydrogenase family protein [Gramella sp. AN32]|uniref:Acyl-CoA dehydrogenase family protein n=1 Tax=Christiangramia antarctica TaxID=2058158 RepID=A0ABW5X8U7_9FLAO|nr:acyl-CoA dehydrogenase family protein [Gramella sp. AN32]MCM4155332.1 acyl-CoA dehydrogenase [Gramella sp. AN32]
MEPTMEKDKKELLINLEGIFKSCEERAAHYDANNLFFQEDFEELKGAGYLLIAVPEEFGGYGMLMDECETLTRKLAYHAAPTALALNMHIYWTGLIADLYRQGDKSIQWVLEEAGRGKVFAAGHGESGNDIPVLYSTCKAEKVEGGYSFTGHKMFGSLTPVWDYLGFHGQDNSDSENPTIIHAFLPRDTQNFEIKKTWDNVMGMRATRSDDTILNDVMIQDKYIVRKVPAGFNGIDGFVLGIFSWALIGFGNIYFGLAKRVVDMVLETLHKKKSISLGRPSMAYHPGIQRDVADMVLELEAIEPHLDTIAREWSQGKAYGAAWGIKIFAAKCHAVEAAWRVVDKAMDVMGGYGISRNSGFERLFRDARLGRIHPSNTYITREVIAKGMLGLDLDYQPR